MPGSPDIVGVVVDLETVSAGRQAAVDLGPETFGFSNISIPPSEVVVP
jgi:hypothetical protein